MKRSYSAGEKATAVALAMTLGSTKRAAAQLSIPRRTLDYWMRHADAAPLIVAAEVSAADRVREIWEKAAVRADAALNDPSTSPRDVAAILKIAGDQLALLEGRATANLAVNATGQTWHDPMAALTDQEVADLRDLIHAVDARIEELDGLSEPGDDDAAALG